MMCWIWSGVSTGRKLGRYQEANRDVKSFAQTLDHGYGELLLAVQYLGNLGFIADIRDQVLLQEVFLFHLIAQKGDGVAGLHRDVYGLVRFHQRSQHIHFFAFRLGSGRISH